MDFRSKLKQGGYDAEEAYFHKRDQELIEKMREDREKAKSQLRLIQGGATPTTESEERKLLPGGRSHKKAA